MGSHPDFPQAPGPSEGAAVRSLVGPQVCWGWGWGKAAVGLSSRCLPRAVVGVSHSAVPALAEAPETKELGSRALGIPSRRCLRVLKDPAGVRGLCSQPWSSASGPSPPQVCRIRCSLCTSKVSALSITCRRPRTEPRSPGAREPAFGHLQQAAGAASAVHTLRAAPTRNQVCGSFFPPASKFFSAQRTSRLPGIPESGMSFVLFNCRQL